MRRNKFIAAAPKKNCSARWSA